jgi:hypothetical protein
MRIYLRAQDENENEKKHFFFLNLLDTVTR